MSLIIFLLSLSPNLLIGARFLLLGVVSGLQKKERNITLVREDTLGLFASFCILRRSAARFSTHYLHGTSKICGKLSVVCNASKVFLLTNQTPLLNMNHNPFYSILHRGMMI